MLHKKILGSLQLDVCVTVSLQKHCMIAVNNCENLFEHGEILADLEICEGCKKFCPTYANMEKWTLKMMRIQH